MFELPHGGLVQEDSVLKHGIYTKHTAKPGQRDGLVAKLLEAGELMQGQPDCLLWIINTAEEPDVAYAYVVWSSKAAHDAALSPEGMPEEMKTLMAGTRPFMSEDVKPEHVFMTPVGGKGL